MFSLENLVIKDKFIRRWVHKEGFSGFKRYVTAAEDKELEAKIAVVEKYNIRIPELVQRIEKCHIEDLDFAGEENSGFLTSQQEGGQVALFPQVSPGRSRGAWGRGSRAAALPRGPQFCGGSKPVEWGPLGVTGPAAQRPRGSGPRAPVRCSVCRLRGAGGGGSGT